MNKYEPYWDGNPSGWTMAESKNYLLIACNEEVELIRKSDRNRITCVGDFYGDPTAGIIDRSEKFCVSVGCGMIVYKLNEPFEEYAYDRDTTQWLEIGRSTGNTVWINAVHQVGDTEVEIIEADGNAKIIKIDI